MITAILLSSVILFILFYGVYLYYKAMGKYVYNRTGLAMLRDTLIAIASIGFLAGLAVASLLIGF